MEIGVTLGIPQSRKAFHQPSPRQGWRWPAFCRGPAVHRLEADTYAIVGTPFTSVYQGIGFSKDTPELRDAFAAGSRR